MDPISGSGRNGFRLGIGLQLWFLRSQGSKSADGANGVRFTRISSVETTFWSEYCKVQTMPWHISGEILQLIVRLSRKGRRQVNIAWITDVTQGAISKICSRYGRLDFLIGYLLAIAKGFPHPTKTNICWEWCVLIGLYQVLVKSPNNSSHWTSPVSAYHHPASSWCKIFSQACTMP